MSNMSNNRNDTSYTHGTNSSREAVRRPYARTYADVLKAAELLH